MSFGTGRNDRFYERMSLDIQSNMYQELIVFRGRYLYVTYEVTGREKITRGGP
jgi:hypothetical protein